VTLATTVQVLINAAQSQIGVPYVWAGETPGQAFDCSGLTQWAAAKAGISLPRVAQDQYDATARINTTGPPPAGALVFFGSSTSAIGHVGISLGNWWMIDAPHTGAAVRAESFKPGSGWAYVGATDPFTATGDLRSSGTLTASDLETTTTSSSTTSSSDTGLVTRARHDVVAIVVTGALLTAGAGTVAAGVWRTTQSRRRAAPPGKGTR
jgi:hypothetical protein